MKLFEGKWYSADSNSYTGDFYVAVLVLREGDKTINGTYYSTNAEDVSVRFPEILPGIPVASISGEVDEQEARLRIADKSFTFKLRTAVKADLTPVSSEQNPTPLTFDRYVAGKAPSLGAINSGPECPPEVYIFQLQQDILWMLKEGYYFYRSNHEGVEEISFKRDRLIDACVGEEEWQREYVHEDEMLEMIFNTFRGEAELKERQDSLAIWLYIKEKLAQNRERRKLEDYYWSFPYLDPFSRLALCHISFSEEGIVIEQETDPPIRNVYSWADWFKDEYSPFRILQPYQVPTEVEVEIFEALRALKKA